MRCRRSRSFIAVSLFPAGKRNDAQRGPSGRAGLSPSFVACARPSHVVIAKSADFLVEFDEGDGLINRQIGPRKKLDQRKSLISGTLSVCGEVAEEAEGGDLTKLLWARDHLRICWQRTLELRATRALRRPRESCWRPRAHEVKTGQY